MGSVEIGGAKNAVLPVIAATLLVPGKFRIKRVPDLRDSHTMARLMKSIGARIEMSPGEWLIDTSACDNPEAPYELVKTMRASFYVLGPLLSRFGHARVSLPGGCAWGPRPVDFHIAAMERLGADVKLDGGYIVARGGSLKGATIAFDISSVGATGNAVMAAVRARGTTVIENAAREPDIVCLCDFLNAMGASIAGVGTETLRIQGVRELRPVDFEVIPDRIEAGTFLIAGAATGGEITLQGAAPEHLQVVLEKLRRAGCSIEEKTGSVTLRRHGTLRAVNVKTAPFPGFPTDLQAQWMALMALARGTSVITDAVYSDRFTHIAELRRLGAQVTLDSNVATVTGLRHLTGAPVMSTDIRASASLIIAAVAASGRSEISRVYHIDRGYERIEEKFRQLGADIRREKE